MPLHLLVVASETPDQRDQRRRRTGASSDETYVETLRSQAVDVRVETVSCVDRRLHPQDFALSRFDAVFFAGSPIAMHRQTEETRSAARFMLDVFEAGIPAFGSCAGLQIAAVAAGGRSEARSPAMQAGVARGIGITEAGSAHRLFAGRARSFDALAMHAHVVADLPEGGTVLARSRDTPVEAAEIRHGNGVFYGVQYHPEIDLREIASALRAHADALVDQDLAEEKAEIEARCEMLEALAADPGRADLAARLEIGGDIIDPTRRLTEISNFLRFRELGGV